MGKRIVIVGGVAGGATAAARARRLDESAEIVMFERGAHVSFASCGLPYHVGEVIPKESTLVLMTPQRFKERLNIDVRVETEITAIDRAARTAAWRNVRTGESGTIGYDALLISTGARPVRPPVPGLDRPGVFTIREIPDTRLVRAWIDEKHVKRAVVVGAGLIGLEMAENLVRRGITVEIVEAAPQVMGHLDPEMAAIVADTLRDNGVFVHTGDSVTEVADDLTVHTKSGRAIRADMVVLGIGVRPESELARMAGLRLGKSGGIAVDSSLRTDDPHIWAVGDVIEVASRVSGQLGPVPLAGPANRQGRLAADSICGRPVAYRGVLGTAVAGVFGLTVASTGLAQKRLSPDQAAKSHAIWLHPKDHVAWYPGAESLHMKLVFDDEGRILGVQVIGKAGAERRVDVVATVMKMNGTVYDLEAAELCYAPQYGAAKDPVNIAGMIAANVLRGDLKNARWEDVPSTSALIVDVREAEEFAAGAVPGATNLPLSRLRTLATNLPRDREVWLYCQGGKRSYDASRALVQLGYDVRNLPGGYETWQHFRSAGLL